MYYKNFLVIEAQKNGSIIWEKTYEWPYIEKADDIVTLDDVGYAVIGDKCDHEFNLESCGSRAKVLFMSLNNNGDLIDEQLWSGLIFIERLPYYSITTTAYWGIAWTAEHNRKGSWVHKWGPNKETVSIFPEGYGGFDISKTSDNGFVIGTWGGIMIKTDSKLLYAPVIE